MTRQYLNSSIESDQAAVDVLNAVINSSEDRLVELEIEHIVAVRTYIQSTERAP